MKHISLLFGGIALLASVACSDNLCALNDIDCDGVPDDLGRAVNNGGDGPAPWDYNNDGTIDGFAVDRNDDGIPDALGLDTNGDGYVDSVDIDLDGTIDESTPNGTYGRAVTPGTGGGPASGGDGDGDGDGDGTPATGGGDAGGPVDQGGGCLEDGSAQLVQGAAAGSGDDVRYAKANVKRGDINYYFITNGWGDNWQYHDMNWHGTSFTVNSFEGSKQSNGAPAGYPSVFLGKYSDADSGPGPLPAPIASIKELNTGTRWSHTGTGDVYNVAYDVWLSYGGGALSSYFMVWLRDPPNEQPAGNPIINGITVAGVPGTWNLVVGEVNGRPIINYVRAEGNDTHELAFDMLTFMNDAVARGYNLNGDTVNSVAIGFELWQGPVTNLTLEDFCVDVQK